MGPFATAYGPWAVVAGASDGTGAVFAENLAARGVNVVLVARRRPLLEELAARLPAQSRVVVQDLSMTDAGAAMGVEVLFPPASLCTDNAAMIALAGAPRLVAGESDGLGVNAEADLPFGTRWSG